MNQDIAFDKITLKTNPIKLFYLIDNLDIEIRDEEGRFLLRGTDLVSKNNIEVNELVPVTINTQIDEKIGNWKTTYDIINEAPSRLEPLSNLIILFILRNLVKS